MNQKTPVTALLVALALVTASACTTAAVDEEMSVAEFLTYRPAAGADEVVTIEDRVIASLNNRTFAMGDGNNAILVVAPNDINIVGTQADRGEVAVVTGTVTNVTEDLLVNVDPAIGATYMNRPAIIASNVQIVDDLELND